MNIDIERSIHNISCAMRVAMEPLESAIDAAKNTLDGEAAAYVLYNLKREIDELDSAVNQTK